MERLISWVKGFFTTGDYWEINKRRHGWDYIQWSNSCDSGIARVYKDRAGVVYYWRYRSSKVADRILKPEQVLWLTCEPKEFFQENVPE